MIYMLALLDTFFAVWEVINALIPIFHNLWLLHYFYIAYLDDFYILN